MLCGSFRWYTQMENQQAIRKTRLCSLGAHIMTLCENPTQLRWWAWVSRGNRTFQVIESWDPEGSLLQRLSCRSASHLSSSSLLCGSPFPPHLYPLHRGPHAWSPLPFPYLNEPPTFINTMLWVTGNNSQGPSHTTPPPPPQTRLHLYQRRIQGRKETDTYWGPTMHPTLLQAQQAYIISIFTTKGRQFPPFYIKNTV